MQSCTLTSHFSADAGPDLNHDQLAQIEQIRQHNNRITFFNASNEFKTGNSRMLTVSGSKHVTHIMKDEPKKFAFKMIHVSDIFCNESATIDKLKANIKTLEDDIVSAYQMIQTQQAIIEKLEKSHR